MGKEKKNPIKKSIATFKKEKDHGITFCQLLAMGECITTNNVSGLSTMLEGMDKNVCRQLINTPLPMKDNKVPLSPADAETPQYKILRLIWIKRGLVVS